MKTSDVTSPLATERAQVAPRRRALATLSAFALTGLAAAVVARARTTGYPARPAQELRVLSAAEFAVVAAVADRMVAPDRAEDRTLATAAELGVAAYVERVIGALPPTKRARLRQLLMYLEQLAPLVAGHLERFSSLDPLAQDQVLRTLAESRIGALRAGFAALKSLVMMGYYRNARTYPLLGYPGPLVPSRAEGR